MTDKLRELAEAATPGPWEQKHGRPQAIIPSWASFDWVASVQVSNVPEWEANAAYIAAANPTAILALLDDLDEATSIIRAFCRSGGSASFGKVTTGVWSLDKLAEAEKRAVAFLSKGEGE